MATLFVIVLALVVGVRVAAFVLAMQAFVLALAIVLAVATGQAVPGVVVATAVALWAGSHLVSRLRRGEWRSSGLRSLSRAAGALRASA